MACTDGRCFVTGVEDGLGAAGVFGLLSSAGSAADVGALDEDALKLHDHTEGVLLAAMEKLFAVKAL